MMTCRNHVYCHLFPIWRFRTVFLAALAACAQDSGFSNPGTNEQGSFNIHLILHSIGTERYQVHYGDDGRVMMESTIEYSDRGNKRSQTAVLRMKRDLTPESFDLQGRISGSFSAETAMVREGDSVRQATLPPKFFVEFGSTPFAVQMMMLRYWASHGKPAGLPVLRASQDADDIRIEPAGRDKIAVDGKIILLSRYTVANVVFGHEIVWLNDKQELAAAMTFAGGLPMEAGRSEYEPALSELFKSGVQEELRTLAAIDRQVPPERSGSFAIAGATLVDGTGALSIPDSVVIVRNGRIARAGSRSVVAIPKDLPVVNATGKTLLPGLWEMHTHFSGVEFGPAMLAAGITTARDCGGEFDFLVAARHAIDSEQMIGPRLLLAGLVDAGGVDAFGAVTAETAAEAKAVVARYHANGFQQIKLYTYLKPDIIAILADEAHRDGMSVTGHVPAALNAFQGVEAGMDQINHLNYVSQMMRTPDTRDPIDLNSAQAAKAIQFFSAHRTVVDPTASWGEMASHTKDVDVRSFEPGITKAPFTLVSKYLSLAGPETDSARYHARMKENLLVIGALHKADIPIVAGSDTDLPGYGLHRELELYVQAGMTPLEAIQTATIGAAKAMKLEGDVGTIEAGKRADLILVDGDPLRNISDIRHVTMVIANGRLYNCRKLGRSVGFHP